MSYTSFVKVYEGFEILKQVKRISPETIMISMSSDAKEETYLEALKLGAQYFFIKPIRNIGQLNLGVPSYFELRWFILSVLR